MKKHIIVCILILLPILASSLNAVNQMPLAFTIWGDQDYDHFGDKLASLDFNGDGYDDLVVLQSWWVPDSIYTNLHITQPQGRDYGRILFYYGGPDFDDVPDFVIEGTRPYQFHLSTNAMYRLGDVNGDGYEDLGIVEHFPKRFDIFFGGSNPSTTPGYTLDLEDPSIDQARFYELGDINGDGYDDFGLWTYPITPGSYTGFMSIIMGGSFEQIIIDNTIGYDASGLHGIGDINNDGYDDFCYTIFRYSPYPTRLHRKIIYYGSPLLDLEDPLILVPDYQEAAVLVAKAVGDVNNDGYDDFIGLITRYGQRLWLGADTIDQNYDILINPNWSGHAFDHCTVSGDFNGDGYSDIIGAEIHLERAALWLGGSNMNGVPDLILYAPSSGFKFGISMASGDFNGDGYDDVVIGEPSLSDDWFKGSVHVYYGNGQLTDTTTSVNDEINPPQMGNWSFRVIPNPSPQGSKLKIKFIGTGYDKLINTELRIYNIKGQLVHRQDISAGSIKSGELTIDQVPLARGIHFASVYEDGQKTKTQKVTIK